MGRCHVHSENGPHDPVYMGETSGSPGRLEEPGAVRQQVPMGAEEATLAASW